MVRKDFIRPEFKVVVIDSADIIATSGTGGSTGGGAWGSARQLNDFDDIDQ